MIIVVGAGPAGLMAAIRAGQLKQDVTLIEKNSSLGRKLLLSGKGRCNLTNACSLEEFLKRFSGNGQFLRDAFKKFFNKELMAFFESRGLKLKVERQLRVFPVTDSSTSIVRVLEKELKDRNVNILFKSSVKDIIIEGGRVKAVALDNGNSISADKIILATGGVSYSFTGSTGQGLKLAGRAGHTIIPLTAGLVPLEAGEKFIKDLEGLTLKNIRLRFHSGKKEIASEVGELLFTVSGISGPLVLTLSGAIADWLKTKEAVYAEIDLKPGLSIEQLDARMLRDFKLNPKKSLKNVLKELLPLRLINLFIEITDLNPLRKTSQITKDERSRMVSFLKAFKLHITGTKPIEEAMVTRGGVSLKEIDPRTMESRLIKGLYFAGEIMDVDADTGGFNLQAAFSTGYLAGESAALK